jgi:hypothetical protein
MSTSPIGTLVPTLAPNAIIRAGIPLSDNFNATDVAVSLGSLLDSSSVSRFDVTFTGLEFRNIGTTPLVLIESDRTIIITSANAILTEQTEAFEFIDCLFAGINTGETYFQLVDAGSINADTMFNVLNGSFGFVQSDRSATLGVGNAVIDTMGSIDSLTGDGFVRILGTYYEIDL